MYFKKRLDFEMEYISILPLFLQKYMDFSQSNQHDSEV